MADRKPHLLRNIKLDRYIFIMWSRQYRCGDAPSDGYEVTCGFLVSCCERHSYDPKKYLAEM